MTDQHTTSDVPEQGGPDRPPVADRPALPDRSRRRWRSPVAGAPVVGYTGANGAGKTLLAVSDAVMDLRAGRRVVSTVPIDCAVGRSEPLLTPRQLVELEDCTVLLDEIAAIFSNRSTNSVPAEVVTFLKTLRHRNVTLRWTAPAWLDCDVTIRRVTQVSVGVRPMLKRRVPGEFWPRTLVGAVGVLDTTDVKTDGTPETILRRRIYTLSRLPGFGAYNTHADTPQLGGVQQTGVCTDCGGTVAREKCSPARHQRLGLPVLEDHL